MPAPIAWLGAPLAVRSAPRQAGSHSAAVDSTVRRAGGGVWQTQDKDRAATSVPQPAIETEAHGPTSGGPGWVEGWKRQLIVGVAAVWLPVAAAVTPANAADTAVAVGVLEDRTTPRRYRFGARSEKGADLRDRCDDAALTPITRRCGPHPHREGGGAVRRVVHALRSTSIAKWHGPCTAIVAGKGPVPTGGRLATRRWRLGAVCVYQLTIVCRFDAGENLHTGLKPFIKAAYDLCPGVT